MAVTKRLRYEILRRDNYTCRYCGATAPDVKLTIDHVTPVALGGRDEPSNLVTACDPCNSGKTSVPADAAIVADVEDDAVRWAAAIRRAAELAHQDYQARLEYRQTFRTEWDGWGAGPENERLAIPLDDNWETSLDTFRDAGLPDWEMAEAVRVAMTNQKVTAQNTFRYFAGICWTKIRQMQERAQQLVAAEGSAPAESPTAREEDHKTDPVHWAHQFHETAWRLYMAWFDAEQQGCGPVGVELIEIGDEIANALQGTAELLTGNCGDTALEERFRKGRSWNAAGVAIREAFDLLVSETPHLFDMRIKDFAGLDTDEIRALLESEQS